MKIVIMGPKGAGKSTVGAAFAAHVGLPCVDTDTLIEDIDAEARGARRTFRDIFKQDGETAFRALERQAAKRAAKLDWHVVITGGGLMLDPDSRRALRSEGSIIVYLWADPEALWPRAILKGTPPWLEGPDGPVKFAEQVRYRDEVLRPFADVILDTSVGSIEEQGIQLADAVSEELAVRQTSANSYGDILRITSFGESHGKALGIVVEGMQPGIPFTEADVQEQLNRRRPGQSKMVTQRKEPDEINILSGVFEGKTTGAPIAMVIYNVDQRSHNYDDIKDAFRPGHGDFTFYKKYAFRDYRGGGRQSSRETAGRVAAGAVPLRVLKEHGVRVVAHAIEVAGIKAETCDLDIIESNPVRCADPIAAEKMGEAILGARSEMDSVGGIIQLEIHGLPPGLGDPIFGKLEARLCTAIMTIGAIKGVEVGDGFAITRLKGSQANDQMREGKFLSNHHGGILGGISTGAPVIMRVAVKPTASIAKPQETDDEHGQHRTIRVLGRHDPCIVPRAVPVIEAMAALVIVDAWRVQERLNPEWAAQHPLC